MLYIDFFGIEEQKWKTRIGLFIQDWEFLLIFFFYYRVVKYAYLYVKEIMQFIVTGLKI